MNRFAQDLVVTAFGVATSIFTAIVLFLVELKFGLSLYTWTFWFVIPIGAILAGFAAATGYYAGARLFGHRPSALILLNMLGVSVGTFFLIHFLGYAFYKIDGRPPSDYVSFGTYLDILLRHKSLGFYFNATKMGSTGELGGWGYAHALLQIGGFALGGASVFGYLLSLPYCENCSKYLSAVGKQERFSSDQEAFVSVVKEVATNFENQRLQEAVNYHAGVDDAKYKAGHLLKSVLQLKHCRICKRFWLGFTAYKYSGRDWKELDDLAFAQFYEGDLRLAG